MAVAPTPQRKSDKRRAAPVEPEDVEETPLWVALREGDFRLACRLVQRGDPPDQREASFGWTPALLAADAGEVRLLTFLLDKQVDANSCCQEGNVPLGLAARRGHLAAACLLLKRNAKVGKKNTQGWSPLMWASMSGHCDIVQELLTSSASLTAKDHCGRNACMWAARYGHQAVVELLLAKGLDANLCDGDGLSAMDHAQDHFELKSAIILAEERCRRLLDAAQRDDAEAALLAIGEGAGCDARDEQGWTPLTWAVLHDSVELAGLLVRHGANPCLLGEASDLGQQVAVPYLEVSERIGHVLAANVALVSAAQAQDWVAADAALRLGARPDAFDERRCTAMLWAARHADVHGIKLLVEHQASLDVKDEEGYTPVMLAIMAGSCEAVALLHHLGASVVLKSTEGDSALHLAVNNDDAVMIQVLLAAKARIDEFDYKHNTPLHLAATSGACASTSTLLNYSANLLEEDHYGRSPLSAAVLAGQLRACEVILSELEDPPELPEHWAPPPEESSADEDSDDETASEVGNKPGVAKAGARPKGKAKAGGRPAAKQLPSRDPPASKQQRPPSAAAQSDADGAGSDAPLSRASSSTGREISKEQRCSAEVGTRLVSASQGITEPNVEVSPPVIVTLVVPPLPDEVTVQESSLELSAEYELLRTSYAEWDSLTDYPRTAPATEALTVGDAIGQTSVHLAVLGRHIEVLRLLFASKAPVDPTDSQGRTPLMEAVRHGYRDMVEELFEHGAQSGLLTVDLAGRKAQDDCKDPGIGNMLSKATILLTSMPRGGAVAIEEPEPPSRVGIVRVRVEQLPRHVPGDVVENELLALCRTLGFNRPLHMEVVRDPITDRPRGFAYMDFSDEKAAVRLMGAEGRDVCGCVIRTVRDLPSAMVR